MPEENVDAMRTLLRTQLQQILYCSPDELDDGTLFPEIGLDSVLGVELLSEVNQRYGLQERVRVLHRHPTVDELAAYLAGRVSGRLPDASESE
jgi:aryl carrier-like protein